MTYLISCMYIYQNHWTPLHKAAHEGHTDVMKVILAAGANIEAKDGVSARVSMSVWYQILRRRHTMLWTLLSYDIFDSIIVIIYSRQNGETSLIWAVAGNHVDAVEMLSKAGADIHALDRVSKRTWIDKYVIVCLYVCAFRLFVCLFVCSLLCLIAWLFDWLLVFMFVGMCVLCIVISWCMIIEENHSYMVESIMLLYNSAQIWWCHYYL